MSKMPEYSSASQQEAVHVIIITIMTNTCLVPWCLGVWYRVCFCQINYWNMHWLSRHASLIISSESWSIDGWHQNDYQYCLRHVCYFLLFLFSRIFVNAFFMTDCCFFSSANKPLMCLTKNNVWLFLFVRKTENNIPSGIKDITYYRDWCRVHL